MATLNDAIAADTTNLGRGYRIGHSFFMPNEPGEYGSEWFERVIRADIIPLLEEYWFDKPDTVNHWRAHLLA